MARDIDADSGRPFIKINHPAPGDVIRNPAHVAGYGTAFEGTISLRISDEGSTFPLLTHRIFRATTVILATSGIAEPPTPQGSTSIAAGVPHPRRVYSEINFERSREL